MNHTEEQNEEEEDASMEPLVVSQPDDSNGVNKEGVPEQGLEMVGGPIKRLGSVDIEAPDTEAPDTVPPSFEEACRFSVSIGKAAYRYGSSGSKIEKFLPLILQRFGHVGVFRLTQSELFCTFIEGGEDMILSSITTHHTIMVEIQDGLSLNKLGLLADLATLVLDEKVTIQDAMQRMDEIDATPDPWNVYFIIASYLMVGGGLAMVFGGTWWDVLIATILGGVCWVTVVLTPMHPRLVPWMNFLSAFVCSLIGTFIKLLALPDLNIVLVVLSAVAILLPGYGVSLGTAELVTSRIVPGAAHLIGGIVVLLWLVVGTWLGIVLADKIALKSVGSLTTTSGQPVEAAFQGLFVPMLCISLALVFQNARRDFLWAILLQGLTYIASYVGSTLTLPNVGVFLSSVAMVVMSNLWASWMNRPSWLVLLPCIVLQVSGSIGFQGVFKVVTPGEDTTLGAEQFLQMFIVALLIIVGLMAGNTIFPSSTTL